MALITGVRIEYRVQIYGENTFGTFYMKTGTTGTPVDYQITDYTRYEWSADGTYKSYAYNDGSGVVEAIRSGNEVTSVEFDVYSVQPKWLLQPLYLKIDYIGVKYQWIGS